MYTCVDLPSSYLNYVGTNIMTTIPPMLLPPLTGVPLLPLPPVRLDTDTMIWYHMHNDMIMHMYVWNSQTVCTHVYFNMHVDSNGYIPIRGSL